MCWGKKIYIWNVRYFSNETLNFFFRKFSFSYILDLAKTVRALQILSQKINSFEHCKSMYLWKCYFAPVVSQRYINYTLVHRKVSYFSYLIFWRKISYFVIERSHIFIYNFPLVLLLISPFQIHNLELPRAMMSLNTETLNSGENPLL